MRSAIGTLLKAPLKPLATAFKPTALALSAIAMRPYKTASCVDSRFTSESIHQIALQAFGGSMKAGQFSYRVPATHIPAGDSSTQNFVEIIKIKAHESDELEKFLLMVHDDCAAIKSGIVKIAKKDSDYLRALQTAADKEAEKTGFVKKTAGSGKEEFDYLAHLQTQVEEFMKNPTFLNLIESGKLELVPALYLHGESKDLVQTFSVKNKDGKAVLTVAKTFLQNRPEVYEQKPAAAQSRLM